MRLGVFQQYEEHKKQARAKRASCRRPENETFRNELLGPMTISRRVWHTHKATSIIWALPQEDTEKRTQNPVQSGIIHHWRLPRNHSNSRANLKRNNFNKGYQ